jgi:peptidoglycan/LPS O-acetylase OafA/YrhL
MRNKSRRNYQFDLLRILFATLVLLSHASEITDGNTTRELLFRATHAFTFGAVGVDGFFLLSGYLIVQSWLGDPNLLNFLRKRILRILPGYLVAVVLSTLAVGLLAPGTTHFFRELDSHFVKSVMLLGAPATPSVFPGRPFAAVNGSLYTIAYEFRCYLLVALLGMCGLIKHPRLILGIALLMLSSLVLPASWQALHWPRPAEAVLGQPAVAFRLTAIYLAGSCFYLFRKRISFRPWLAVGAGMLIGLSVFVPALFELVLVICGSYLLFYLGQMPLTWPWERGFPDISYGVYLYGWPVESLWIWFHRGSPWVAFGASAVMCAGCGWLSWHFVERPALTLKRKPSAPLPDASHAVIAG